MSLLGSALELSVIGMGVVFLSLIGLMYVIKLLNRLFTDEPAEAAASAASGGGAGEEGELPLLLSAAAGYFLETEGADVFIPEVSRSGDSGWARRARSGRAFPGRPR